MQEISVQALKAWLDSGEPFTLIDVREPYEAELSTLGGKLIPMGEVLSRLSEIPQTGKVVMHCRSGGRSSSVIQVLQEEFGYSNLLNLKGGIMAWAAEIDPNINLG
ncbi:MAG: rhodanese-like domain-containing protein [Bacteroidetes bacterium]|nr:rhodanese-like domain-containing protein [Bacteroidota bacterium]